MPQIVYKTTGPFTLIDIDDTDSLYLKLKFDDGHIRKMAKGRNWPPHLAIALHEKAQNYLNQKVHIITSQTTDKWNPKDWLCDIRPVEEQKKRDAINKILSQEGRG